ncbi:MAG: NAD(P)H-dependent oxidoreductase [Candidatus Omnitrophica bacterium]|nr:NAD(P)H-dependent oxidoreductase [Candidatus Omnitrophota bacterium]
MKSIIIFYSYTGNTKKVAQILEEYLTKRDEVKVIELEAEESNKFLIQAIRAFRHTEAKLKPVNFNLAEFDLICIGTPVWAFAPAPAINTFLKNCFGLEGKEVVLFATYGSGLGKDRCLNYMEAVLNKKGVRLFRKFLIPESNVGDKEFIISQIRSILG